MSRSFLRRFIVGPVALMIVALAIAACTGNSESTATSVPADGGNPEQVDLSAVQPNVRLAEMWGHLEISAASAENGNLDDATLHAAHPVAEYWQLISSRLEEAGQAAAVRDALDAYQEEAQSGGDVATALDDVRDAVLAAMGAVSDGQIDEPQFRAAVIRDLVESIEHEFEESVEGQEVTDLAEYQDAWGFLQVAKALYEPISAEAEEIDGEAAHEIEEEFEALDAIFTSLRPSAAPGSVADVEEAIGEIRAELAKIFELGANADASPEEIVHQVEEMLEHAIVELREGESEEAYELAANAYLEGFEHIEGAIIQAGHRDLVEDLELKLKDFRDGVRDGASVESLEQLRAEIEAGLAEALEAIS